MNTMLGGMFQSRLNANIREEKGYSYGVDLELRVRQGSGRVPHRRRHRHRQERRGAGRVHEGAARHPRRAAGDRRGAERRRRTALIQRLPATFASVSSINGALTTLWTQSLPDDYYQQYAKSIAAITKDDVAAGGEAVHRPSIDLAIVIVGDRSVIEAPLKATNIAPIVYYDIEGNPVSSK